MEAIKWRSDRRASKKAKASPAQTQDPLTKLGSHPAPEDHLGIEYVCSPEMQPSTDDDVPLD